MQPELRITHLYLSLPITTKNTELSENRLSKLSDFMLFLCFPKQGAKEDFLWDHTASMGQKWDKKPTISTSNITHKGFFSSHLIMLKGI